MVKKKFEQRLHLKLLSIIFAIVAWLIITYTVDPSITYVIKNVPITFTGENALHEQGLTLLNRESYDKINIKVRGPRSSVINSIDTVSASADISDITSNGEQIENVDVNLGISGVMLVNRTKLSVTVSVDKLVDKEVPVKVLQSGVEKNKQTLIASQSENETIVLRGAKTELDKVSQALVSVDISTIDANTTRPLTYTLTDDDNTKLNCSTLIDSPKNINVTSLVCRRKTVSVVPSLTGQHGNNVSLNVKSVSKDKVDVGISDGAPDIDTVYAYISPSDYSPDREEYTLEIETPEGIYINEGSRTVTARLVVENKITKQVSLDIELRNAPKNAALVQSSIDLLLYGTETALNSSKVKAYVDAGGLTSGYHELTVYLETDADIAMLEPANVGINIE